MRKINLSIIFVFIILTLTSCARAPVKLTPTAPACTMEYDSVIYRPAIRQDVFHVIAPGETLWRLGKMYDVTVEDIIRENNLKDTAKLDTGQRLCIPNAAPLRPVVSLYPTGKWKYIIIHHSATDEGNALCFDKFHRRRGWKNLGYHFVIDNGSEGKQDGQIEVAPRWIKQQDGAHCKAGSMNSTGIGICLVGNFSKEKVTEKQMRSLAYLVNTLREYYNIPVKNILGHGEVLGASTECPGTKFPWNEFYNKISYETNGQ